MIDSITSRFWMLAENPGAGRAAPEAAPNVRCFPAGQYLIYYRKMRRGIEVVHILHSARNRDDALRDRHR
jgi:toxin ParE1/3/4